MKKIKNIILVLLGAVPLLVAVSGCEKFLDRKPLTATIEDLNQGALDSKVFGMYFTLRDYAGFSTLPWLDFHSIRDDDAEKGSSQTDGAEVNAEFETFQYSKDDWAPNTYWNDRYYMIAKANETLEIGAALEQSPAVLRNMGEAYFFRAYCYFDLVRTYGEVPKIDFVIKKAAQGIVAKSPEADIYALIDADLTKAAQNLPMNAVEYGVGYTGRLTKGAAKTLWAQSYMFRKNYGQAKALCAEVVASGQYSLTPSFVDVWKDGVNGVGKNGPESIFEMQASCGANAQSTSSVNNGSAWGTCQNVRQGGATNDWNLGWGWNTPTDKLVTAWDNTDPRKAVTVLFSGQSDGGPATGGYGATLPPYSISGSAGTIERKYWNKKVYSDPAMRAFTGFINGNGAAPWYNHRILRYADVLLMLAEAANETGDGAAAAANLELVRKRASGDLPANRVIVPYIAFANQAQMRTAIKNERRFEFAMEGYRFFDLVRWGDAVAELGPLGYTDRCKFYPIPQKAIDLSGGVLKQNPLW
jgi:starch-binding outer membrane protein, SusD/RagB family